MSKLGTPAIPTPAKLDLPAIQQTVANIRERFQRLEASVVAGAQASNAGATTAAAVNTQAALAALRREVSALTERVEAAELEPLR